MPGRASASLRGTLCRGGRQLPWECPGSDTHLLCALVLVLTAVPRPLEEKGSGRLEFQGVDPLTSKAGRASLLQSRVPGRSWVVLGSTDAGEWVGLGHLPPAPARASRGWSGAHMGGPGQQGLQAGTQALGTLTFLC